MRRIAVMALSIIIFAFPGAILAYDGPTVVDDANFLAGDQLIELRHTVEAANAERDFLLVILTVPTLEGQEVELYTKAVMRTWGIGRENRDDGLLLLIVRDEMLFYFRAGQDAESEVSPEHLEYVKSGILVPSFERREYLAGLIEAVDALGSEETGPPAYLLLWIIPIALVLIFLFANTANRKSRKCPNCGKRVSPLVSRCPSCLSDLRVRRTEPCPCGSEKPYEDCCLDRHTEGRDSHRIQFLRVLDLRYLMQHSTSFGGYTGGGPGELPSERDDQGKFEGTGVVGGF